MDGYVSYIFLEYGFSLRWLADMLLARKGHLLTLLLVSLMRLMVIFLIKLILRRHSFIDFISNSVTKLILNYGFIRIAFLGVSYYAAYGDHGSQTLITIIKYILLSIVSFMILRKKVGFNIGYFLLLVGLLFVVSYFPLYYLGQYLINIYPTHPALFEFLYGVERI